MRKLFYEYLVNINSISVYKNIKNDKLIKLFLNLFKKVCCEEVNYTNFFDVLNTYSEICSEISKHSKSNLTSYIKDLVLYDENLISLDKFDNNILEMAQKEFKILCQLATTPCKCIIDLIYSIYSDFVVENQLIPYYMLNLEDELPNFDNVMNSYKKNGVGIFAKYRSFVFDENLHITPIINPDKILLKDLKLYEAQKNTILKNTNFLIKNLPCQNILLYGDRGCGKSSAVKAVANEFADKGLRIIQIKKNNLQNLDILISKLASISLKFIIFIDDLTFNENDENFNILKAILDGSLCKQPKNVVIYATTNRCHFIKETFTAREGDEVHLSDTIDEIMSLSDRFGIVINYEIPAKDDFLEIVKLLAVEKNINIPQEQLFKGAEIKAIEKSARSPRIAAQYIAELCSSCAEQNDNT